MANTLDDLLSVAKFLSISDRFASVVRLLLAPLGDATEDYKASLSTDITASASSLTLTARSGSLTWEDVLPPMGTITISTPMTVTLSGTVIPNDSLTINGVVFNCVASGATGNEFNVGATDADTATSLAGVINASTTFGIDGNVSAAAVGTVITLTQEDPLGTGFHTVFSSASRLACSKAFFGGGERIRYSSVVSSNVLNLSLRGADGTMASNHLADSVILLPASASRLALRALEDVVGDGSTLYGVGATQSRVISDLNGFLDTLVGQIKAAGDGTLVTGSLETLTRQAFEVLDGHFLQRSQNLLVGVPSWVTDGTLFRVDGINTFCRYQNDRDLGTPFSCLVPDRFAQLYWFFQGGTPLDSKVVFPDVTVLASATIDGAGVFTWTLEPGLTRWSESDTTNKATRTQGMAAQRIQARVTTAGTGSATILLTCQGQASDGDYFGRPSTATITCGSNAGTTNQPNDGDTVTVAGVTLTFRTLPTLDDEVNIGPDNVSSALALALAIQALTDAGTLNINATASSNSVVLTVAAATETDPVTGLQTNIVDNYDVSVSNDTRLPLSAGTLTGQSLVTFGGGAGESIDGTGADSDQPDGVATDDNPRTFGGASAFTLPMSTVNNTLPIVATDVLDRVHRIIAATGSTSGADGEIVIETLSERAIP